MAEGPGDSGFDEVAAWEGDLVDAAPDDIREDVELTLTPVSDAVESDGVLRTEGPSDNSADHQAAERRILDFLTEDCGWVDGGAPGSGPSEVQTGED
jgi:hypothetical protein